jgi:hypothetical protein|tara:strand:+ start:512 stop:880 length:369 start_codon:yes stop_codon:yes gene_type:complete
MPDNPTDHTHETHIGWQRTGTGAHVDSDHLVIDGTHAKSVYEGGSAMVTFEDQGNKARKNARPDEPSQPSFLNVDAQGLDSPLELLGSNEPPDEPSVQPLVWYGEGSEFDSSLDRCDQQVFS